MISDHYYLGDHAQMLKHLTERVILKEKSEKSDKVDIEIKFS